MSLALCEKKVEKQKLIEENLVRSSELAKRRENYMLKRGWMDQQKLTLQTTLKKFAINIKIRINYLPHSNYWNFTEFFVN